MVHESIGVSPAQLLFGNTTTLDTEIFVPKALSATETPLSEWASTHLEQQRILLERAQQVQQTRDETNLSKRISKRSTDVDSTEQLNPKKTRPAKTITDDFEIGSYVLVSYPDSILGKNKPPHKLMMPQKGPYEIVEKHRGSYSIRELATNVVTQVNSHLLRPYEYDPEHDDPVMYPYMKNKSLI